MSMYREGAELYDLINSAKDYPAEVTRIRALLAEHGIPEGSSLLDAACGTGRHLEGFEQHYRAAGFDQSEEMLAVARRRLKSPVWVADFLDFVVPEPVDAVTCLLSAIGYLLDEPSLRAAALRFGAAVRPGGVLIVEPWLTVETWDVGRPVAQAVNSPDLSVARVNVAEREGEISPLNLQWLVVPRGGPVRSFVEHHRLWLCPHPTLLAAFDAAGFECRMEPQGFTKDRGLLIGVRRG